MASGAVSEACGAVENVTLRLNMPHSSDGAVFTVPNAQIVESVSLSKGLGAGGGGHPGGDQCQF